MKPEEKTPYLQRNKDKNYGRLLTETFQTRKKGMKYLKCSKKKKTCKARILYPNKLLKSERE